MKADIYESRQAAAAASCRPFQRLKKKSDVLINRFDPPLKLIHTSSTEMLLNQNLVIKLSTESDYLGGHM